MSVTLQTQCVPNGPVDNDPALLQVMVWHQTVAKPLSGPMLTYFNDAYIRHSASISKHLNRAISRGIS